MYAQPVRVPACPFPLPVLGSLPPLTVALLRGVVSEGIDFWTVHEF